jgi:hypothetical protein
LFFKKLFAHCIENNSLSYFIWKRKNTKCSSHGFARCALFSVSPEPKVHRIGVFFFFWHILAHSMVLRNCIFNMEWKLHFNLNFHATLLFHEEFELSMIII